MSEPYVFQYDTIDGGRKRPLRRGIIVLGMQHENENLKLCVHADTLAASSGLINRVFEEFVDTTDDAVCTVEEKSCFPIPSFSPAILDEFLCNVYGQTYVSRGRELDLLDIESRSNQVFAAIDLAIFFDATEPHFTRLDKDLFDVVQYSRTYTTVIQDVYLDILMRIEPLASKLPNSWSQTLKNVISYANSVSLASLDNDPLTTFPTEVVMHPTFKLLRDSTREKIAWALLRSQHKAWRINSQRRKTASRTQITEIVSELVPRFVEGSHEFEVSGPLPINASFYTASTTHPTFVQLYVDEGDIRVQDEGNIRVHARLGQELVCRIHADLTLTYRDGSTEKIKTPRAGVEQYKCFGIRQSVSYVVSVAGKIRIDYCDS